jgi:dUTP pyrophosphatase
MSIDVGVFKFCNSAVLPEKQTSGAAGYDIRSVDTYDFIPDEIKLMSTGLALVPESNWDLFFFLVSRSSIAKRFTILNSPGTIDNDYRGEVKILLKNITSGVQRIDKEERIAQLIPIVTPCVNFHEITEFKQTSRNSSGFGSTGRF